jgi:hypothetical protein
MRQRNNVGVAKVSPKLREIGTLKGTRVQIDERIAVHYDVVEK